MDRQNINASADLAALKADAFEARLIGTSSPAAMRALIRRTNELNALAEDYRMGILSESTIRNFVDELLQTFTCGQRFSYTSALAALAVLMETIPLDFAEEFLLDLARLNRPEFAMANRVAKLCLMHRVTRTRTITKAFEMSDAYSNSDQEDEVLVNELRDSTTFVSQSSSEYAIA
jgi:hypothetical protein